MVATPMSSLGAHTATKAVKSSGDEVPAAMNVAPAIGVSSDLGSRSCVYSNSHSHNVPAMSSDKFNCRQISTRESLKSCSHTIASPTNV